MGWEMIASLIAQYGLPFVQKLITKAESGKNVTSADLTELDAISQMNPQYHLALVAQKAGLAITDPKILALAELIK